MSQGVYRYVFASHVLVEDIESTLLLAIWGAESLHGEAQTRLDATHFLDRDRRACVIDAGTPVGRDINRLFIGFVRREFGEDAFKVQRVDAIQTQQPEEAQT
jgi:hypothetical protein